MGAIKREVCGPQPDPNGETESCYSSSHSWGALGLCPQVSLCSASSVKAYQAPLPRPQEWSFTNCSTLTGHLDGAPERDRGRVAHPGDTKLFWSIAACAWETHGHHPPYPELYPPDAKGALVGRCLRPEDAATRVDTEDVQLLPE